MSVFTKFKDIVEANINAMLAKSENPQRMLRLMIQDMEDTLVEMKVTCAQAMAERAGAKRTCDRIKPEIDHWTQRAELAVSRNREDMAREALLHRRQVKDDAARLEDELKALDDKIAKDQADISLVEEKLRDARERYLSITRRVDPPEKTVINDETAVKKQSRNALAETDADIENELRAMKSKKDENNPNTQISRTLT